MSVPTALDEDDPTGVVAASPGEGGDAHGTDAPDHSTAGRRALREARRQRRRLMGVCAVIVAACLVMTVLIVGMARDRPAPGTPTGVVNSAGGLLVPIRPALSPSSAHVQEHGAEAPEGGHR
jgi:hypothetical protein